MAYKTRWIHPLRSSLFFPFGSEPSWADAKPGKNGWTDLFCEIYSRSNQPGKTKHIFSVAKSAPKAETKTFGGLIRKPISWQKAKVLTSKQNATKGLAPKKKDCPWMHHPKQPPFNRQKEKIPGYVQPKHKKDHPKGPRHPNKNKKLMLKPTPFARNDPWTPASGRIFGSCCTSSEAITPVPTRATTLAP